MKKNNKKQYTKQQLIDQFSLTNGIIDQYFPAPREVCRKRRGKPYYAHIWSEETVKRAMEKPAVRREIEKIRVRKEKKARREAELRSYLSEFDIERFREQAEAMNRRFVLHIGPTNSGKTYDAIEALKESRSGLYLGPLRLLALEMFDKLNASGCPCNLLTGEEFINVDGADFTSSTIELCTYNRHFDTAVIDEAQMLSDRNRGDKWLKAIYCVNASEVHICMAPNAKDLVCRILDGFHGAYTIVNHERLTPLNFIGPFQTIKDTKPGDALIVFSRRAVLAVAADLDQIGIPASVIYGALPPASRREEIRKFSNGETSVVVATDAIGMGVSLPIKRVIFCEANKFDGFGNRPLYPDEIKQIAGRAGRYGIYNEGEVLSMVESTHIKEGLEAKMEPIYNITLPFPEETLDSDYTITQLFKAWNDLPMISGVTRADMTDALFLYEIVKNVANKNQKKLVYDLIICPFDIKDDNLISYWFECCRTILLADQAAYREAHREPSYTDQANQKNGKRYFLPEPFSGTETLEECERRYRELDIRHQLLRSIGIEEDRMDEKLELCKKINEFLTFNKDQYLRRCRRCGKPLPSTYSFGICEKCYQRMHF